MFEEVIVVKFCKIVIEKAWHIRIESQVVFRARCLKSGEKETS